MRCKFWFLKGTRKILVWSTQGLEGHPAVSSRFLFFWNPKTSPKKSPSEENTGHVRVTWCPFPWRRTSLHPFHPSPPGQSIFVEVYHNSHLNTFNSLLLFSPSFFLPVSSFSFDRYFFGQTISWCSRIVTVHFNLLITPLSRVYRF